MTELIVGSRKRSAIYLLLILILGTALRLFRLGHQSFWWDEVYSATLSSKSLATVALNFGQTPTLYHVLLHFWLYLGRSDAMIRLLSVLFAIAALWAVYLLGKNLLDERHGLLCALLMAVSPFHIWYSQEARMYSLLILLSTASMLFFIKLLQKPKSWAIFWWPLSMGLAIYTHYYAAFILVCQVLFLLIFHKRYDLLWSRLRFALLALVVVSLPILYLFFINQRFSRLFSVGAGGNPFRIFSIPYTFFAFSLGFSYGPSIAELHRSISLATLQSYLTQILLATLLFSGLFILGLRSLWGEREKLVAVLLYLLVPVLGASLVSLLWPQVSYNVRYVSVALPIYLLVIARGLLTRRKRFIRWTLSILVMAMMLYSVWNHYYHEKYAKEDYRSAAQFITEDSEDGDIIMVTNLTPFQYYYQGTLPTRQFLWSPSFFRRMLEVQTYGYRRAWFVLSREWGSDPEGKMSNYMKNTFAAVSETTFANLYVNLYDLTTNRSDRGINVPRREGK
jgi:mannosyltransferase